MDLRVLPIVFVFVFDSQTVQSLLELALEHGRRRMTCLCAGSVAGCGGKLVLVFGVLGYSAILAAL